MKTTTGWLACAALTIAVALAAAACPGLGQEAAGGLAGSRGTAARREGNVVSVNGAPTVLTWARGLQDPADLDRYAALGLNTVYLTLTGVSAEELQQASNLAAAAEARGLLVVIGLSPSSLQDEAGEPLPVDALSEAYVAAVDAFVAAAVEGMGEHPRLLAWSVQAVSPTNVVNDDAGFQSYLSAWYESLNALNLSWGTEFVDWAEVTLSGARDVDSGLPEGIGRASVDYAYYRESAYAEALSVWARALRAADPRRLVLAAAVADYRSAVSVPRGFDGIVLATYPDSAEPDWRTHNVHAVDIARRANTFAACQTLQVDPETSPSNLVGWAGLALSHGAAGVAFSSWSALKDSPELQAAVSEIATMIQGQAYPVTPMARTAVIYEPLAGGAMTGGESLYGYLDGVTPDSPTSLFVVARMGSRFGLLDILRWDMIEDSDLSQYGAIIAPMVFYLPDGAQLALQNYVLRGGALVVDAGAGMYQADGTITSMPAILRETLKLRYADLSDVSQAGDREPTVEYGDVYDPAAPTDVVPLTPGQQEGETIDPALTRFVQALEDFVTRADVAEFLGDTFVGEAGEGFRVSGLGKGFAVYAPDFLYGAWNADDPYFDEFHDRVLSNESDLEVVEPSGVWPGVAATLYDDWSVGVASPESVPTSVLVSGAGNQVYWVPNGAVRLGSAAEEDRVELLFPGAPAARAVPVPVFVWPLADESVVTLSLTEYGRSGIELIVHGTGAGVQVRDGSVRIGGGEQTPIGIEVRGGLGPMSADSMYRVTIEQGARGRLAKQWDTMPDPDTGWLLIQETINQARIRIEPISS